MVWIPPFESEPLPSTDSRSGIGIYLREIGRTPLLTPDEERLLADRVQAGDPVARDHMIRANLRFVVKVAQTYNGMGLPLLDLIAEGNIGLMKAVERFDAGAGNRFSTYACHWIKQAVKRALANQTRSIRLPIQIVDKVAKIRKIGAMLATALGREPTDEEVADELGIPQRKVAALRRVSQPTVSLSATQGESGEELGQLVADASAASPVDQAADHEMEGRLAQALAWLSERERHIVGRRFGLTGEEPASLEALGAEYGLSRERIRQIEVRALKRLRRALERDEKPKWDPRELRTIAVA